MENKDKTCNCTINVVGIDLIEVGGVPGWKIECGHGNVSIKPTPVWKTKEEQLDGKSN